MRAFRSQGPSAGFTLIELLVVVVILGIVAGLALPSFFDAIVRSRIASQHNELLAGLSVARGEAIRRNNTVALCAANAAQDACQSTWASNWLVWEDGNANNAVDAGEEVLQVGSVSDAEVLSAIGSTGAVLRFSPRGLRAVPDDTVNPVQLQIRAASCPTGKPGLTRTITILPTGATRSAEPIC